MSGRSSTITTVARRGNPSDLAMVGPVGSSGIRGAPVAMQMTLTPDGAGGFDGSVQALLDRDVMVEAARIALTDQITFAPELSRPLWELFDEENDGAYAANELVRNPLFNSLTTPDVDKEGQWISFAFGVHLVPCPQGACVADLMPIVDACDDLARHGEETGIDCGGTCGKCAVGRECTMADVDCGGNCSTKCAPGAFCGYNFDCASGTCVGGTVLR